MKLRYPIIIAIAAFLISVVTEAIPGFIPGVYIIHTISNAVLYIAMWATVFLAIWTGFKKGLKGLKDFIFELIDKIKE